ncbi:MAG: ParA family protein [Pseudomonadota bacterium]
MKTVLVANRKGGVGKTMIAVTLASALANRMQRVALADADRQQSALGWLEQRPKDAARIRALDWTKTSDIGDHPKKLDWLVIDAPGALKGSKVETLIAQATAVLAPVQPSFFDAASTEGFLADIEEIKRIRKGKVPVEIIANRCRQNSRAATALKETFAEIGRTPLAWLSERAAYADLAASGLTIFDRNLKVLDPIKAQWSPILDAIGA